MRIKNLKIKNIGPFKSAELNFIENDEELQNPPVIILTGENGTGKTILLDAIRALLKGAFGGIEREITALPTFSIASEMVFQGKNIAFSTNHKANTGFQTNQMNINTAFNIHAPLSNAIKTDFIFDYWTSKLSSDSFNVNNITALETKRYLGNVLSGIHKNEDVAKRCINFWKKLLIFPS
jgi:predicted ATP-binding protein involved in virulence